MHDNRYKAKRKLSKGPLVSFPRQLIDLAAAGGWVFFGDKAYSGQWIVNMNFGCVMSYLRHGALRKAIRNPEYPYVFKATFFEAVAPEGHGEWYVTCSEVPEAKIICYTKESAIEQAVAAAKRKSGNQEVKVQVTFIVPESELKPALLLTS